ncbi:hypothetical protein [Paenibacillus graminis]|uniref:hypothetical protein n=1 Tax=Paenibacillus graminis TaxID=189425 RepID=UPI002DB98957|nr:hypothetical protein [Paenibacillus graminis]MEC0168863.1 hypothetical protein [Paenibacillus graminis]
MDAKTLKTILAAISGIVLDWVGGSRAFKQDISQEAGNGAALKTDVEYIKRGVDDMRLEQRAQGLRFDVLSERVTRMMSNDTLALATLVAAYLGVAKGLGLKVKWVNLAAVGIAAVFVLAPDAVRQKI